ncbi:hypothetical protein BDV96DRAFT_689758 [Lophiotrema nucula]|uniref:Uncharacterized protein n=1 Tax=Lophiotrema nucula TaxID=690887 RepID=A0A6A5YYN0_9PLEO|nr:hypothetical protein BDV96DRAFT_689758 [Lophiotrema nucula]
MSTAYYQYEGAYPPTGPTLIPLAILLVLVITSAIVGALVALLCSGIRLTNARLSRLALKTIKQSLVHHEVSSIARKEIIDYKPGDLTETEKNYIDDYVIEASKRYVQATLKTTKKALAKSEEKRKDMKDDLKGMEKTLDQMKTTLQDNNQEDLLKLKEKELDLLRKKNDSLEAKIDALAFAPMNGSTPAPIDDLDEELYRLAVGDEQDDNDDESAEAASDLIDEVASISGLEVESLPGSLLLHL